MPTEAATEIAVFLAKFFPEEHKAIISNGGSLTGTVKDMLIELIGLRKRREAEEIKC